MNGFIAFALLALAGTYVLFMQPCGTSPGYSKLPAFLIWSDQCKGTHHEATDLD